ncbi:hypothetical protein [Streptomyces meridianus]|uniref:Uncharacterized protein n=1 Tax=Streptomyces meridianus TaxID=2938945 RepID=A0ABT0XCN2_9ACTN|nr:hypothetical protein [Streptomyces meridianus]MCM2580284.1 hypothetical protein [Streptomyces meridianus]
MAKPGYGIYRRSPASGFWSGTGDAGALGLGDTDGAGDSAWVASSDGDVSSPPSPGRGPGLPDGLREAGALGPGLSSPFFPSAAPSSCAPERPLPRGTPAAPPAGIGGAPFIAASPSDVPEEGDGRGSSGSPTFTQPVTATRTSRAAAARTAVRRSGAPAVSAAG